MAYPDEKIKQIIGGSTVSSSDFTENIPATTTTSGVFSYANGYPEETSTPLGSGGKPPRRQDQNGILRLFSKWLYWFQSGGCAQYDSTLDYPVGAKIYHNGEHYWCIQANGASSTVAEPSDTDYWKPFTRTITLTGAVTGTGTISKNNTTITTTSSSTVAPVGTVITYAGTTETITTGDASSNAPTGWLWCNGGAVSRTSFANLFAKIGTTYGAGDGSTTFNVPNLMNERITYGSTISGTQLAILGFGGAPDWANSTDMLSTMQTTRRIDFTADGMLFMVVNNGSQSFNNTLYQSNGTICGNVHFDNEDDGWSTTSIPVPKGGYLTNDDGRQGYFVQLKFIPFRNTTTINGNAISLRYLIKS